MALAKGFSFFEIKEIPLRLNFNKTPTPHYEYFYLFTHFSSCYFIPDYSSSSQNIQAKDKGRNG